MLILFCGYNKSQFPRVGSEVLAQFPRAGYPSIVGNEEGGSRVLLSFATSQGNYTLFEILVLVEVNVLRHRIGFVF